LRLGTAVAEGSGIASPAQDRLVSGAVNKTFLVGHTKFWVPSTVQGRRQCAGRKCGDKVLWSWSFCRKFVQIWATNCCVVNVLKHSAEVSEWRRVPLRQ